MSIYEQGLGPRAVNHLALSPLGFIERSASVYPDYPAVIHGAVRRTWAETYARCRRLASALARRGVGEGDTVAVMLPNIPEMPEAHFGVPMAGAVLNTLNTRLDAETIAFMLRHGEAKVLITDQEFHEVIQVALRMLDTPPPVVDVDDPEYGKGEALGALDYETLRLRDPETRDGRCSDRGHHRLLPGASGSLQGTPRRGVRPLAQDLHGKDPEVPVARGCKGSVRPGKYETTWATGQK